MRKQRQKLLKTSDVTVFLPFPTIKTTFFFYFRRAWKLTATQSYVVINLFFIVSVFKNLKTVVQNVLEMANVCS